MSVLIKGLNLKPCKDGFDGKGLVIIGYDDKLYAVAHEQIIPLPDHGDLIDRDKLLKKKMKMDAFVALEWVSDVDICLERTVIPAERGEE